MGSGFRTFASGEVLTSSNVQNYLMDQAVMVFAGTAERGSALPSPELGMTAYSTATGLQVYNGSAWVDVSTGYGSGTGGSGTAVGTAIGGVTYNVHTFTTDSNFVVTKAGLFDLLLVGGGGGGNLNVGVSRSWGGGGGGQVIGWTSVMSVYLAAGTVAVDVGAGGAQSSNGFPTNFGTLVTACGGGRESGATDFDSISRPYGSGGGGSNGLIGIDTLGTLNVNNGGDADTGLNAAGGGGGAAGAGGNKVNATTGGAGGNGLDISGFIGGATYYAGAGGGGGGSGTGGAAGNGGVAGKTSGNANDGVNYGAGGGGSHGSNLTGGAGAAGVVVVRYRV